MKKKTWVNDVPLEQIKCACIVAGWLPPEPRPKNRPTHVRPEVREPLLVKAPTLLQVYEDFGLLSNGEPKS